MADPQSSSFPALFGRTRKSSRTDRGALSQSSTPTSRSIPATKRGSSSAGFYSEQDAEKANAEVATTEQQYNRQLQIEVTAGLTREEKPLSAEEQGRWVEEANLGTPPRAEESSDEPF